MSKLVLRKHKESDDNWISVSDLMAGLMVVFLFILIIYVKSFQDKYNQDGTPIYSVEYYEKVIQKQNNEINIIKDTNIELEAQLEDINIS